MNLNDIEKNRHMFVVVDPLQGNTGVLESVKMGFTWSNDQGEIMMTDSMDGLFPGEYLFRLKSEMGLPLDFSVQRVLDQPNTHIEWVSFIDTARKNGWWDFQIYDTLVFLRNEMGKEHVDYFDQVIQRFKVYVMNHPLTR